MKFLSSVAIILFTINSSLSQAENNCIYETEFYNFDKLNLENVTSAVTPDSISESSLAKLSANVTSACVNTSVVFTNSTVPGNGSCSNVANYSWDFGDGTTASSTQLTSPQSKSHIYTQPGTYTVKLTAQNACNTITNTQQICIEKTPMPVFSVDVNQGCAPLTVHATNMTDVSSVCSTLNYTWDVSYSPGSCGTSSAYNYSGGTSSSSENPTFQFTNSGIYTIRLTASNLCGSYSITQEIEVKQPPIVSIDNIPDFCGTAAVNPTATIKSCSSQNNLNYAWTFPGGLPSSSTDQNPVNISYSTPGQYTVYLKVSNECGVSEIVSKTFTVKKTPKLTTAPLNQSVCSGMSTSQVDLTADLLGTTFSWTATATSGISGFITSGATNYLPVQTLSTTEKTSGTVTYAITLSSDGCAGPIAYYVVTLNPTPIIANQPVSSTVCVGGTPDQLSVTTANGVGVPSYQWYSNNSNNNTSGSPIGGEANSTYNPSGTTVGTTYYYCVITFAGGCTAISSNVAAVTVNPKPTISPQPISTQDICVGGTIGIALSVGYTGGTGYPTYQWFSNTTNSNSGGTPVSGATSSTFLPSAFNAVGLYYYYCEVTLSGSNCGSVVSNAAAINVVSDPVVSSHPVATQTICQNTTPTTLSVSATGGTGNYLYQWYQNTTGNTSTGTLIGGATSQIYVPSTATVGTSYYYCFVTTDGLNCNVTSNSSEVIVNAQPTVVTQPVSGTVCLGGTPDQLSVTTANGVGTPSYQWYSNSSNENTSGSPIGGETNSTYNPSGATVGTTYYYCVITFAGGCTAVSSNVAAVTVNPKPTISPQPMSTQDICVGGTIATALSVGYTGGTGYPTYQWFSNTTNSNIGGTPISGATSSTFLPSAFNAVGLYYYYCEVTLSGSNCGSVISNVAVINVVPDPVVSSQPIVTQTICQNTTPSTLSVSATGGTGNYLYQWYQNTTNNTTTGTSISGATSQTYVPLTATVGTSYYYCLITTDGLNCNVTSNSSEVIVNAQPTVVTQPVSSTVCVGGTPDQLLVTTANGVGTPSYQWYSNSSNDNTSGSPIGGETNSTYNPSGATVGAAYYYCVITFAGGCTAVSSDVAVVTVNPKPTIDTQPTLTQEICAGTSIVSPLSVSYIDGTGKDTYQWFSNTSNSYSGSTLISGATDASYNPPVFMTAGNYYYYCEVTLSGSNCGSTISHIAEVIVDANPVVSPQSVPTQSLCINATPQTLSVTASAGTGAYTYQWFENNANSSTGGTQIAGATTNSYIPLTDNLGTKYYYCEVKNSAGVYCGVISDVATVIVNPEPTFTSQPASSVICVDGTTTLSVTYKDGAGIPAYQWYRNSVNDSSTGIPILSETNSTFNPPSAVAGTTYYYCIITLTPGGCAVLVSNVAQVVVNPNPVISQFNREICNGTSFAVTPDVSDGDIVPVGTTYTWSMPVISPANSVTGASAESNPQSTISQTLTNTTTSSATVTYTVSPLSNDCPGHDFKIIVTVDPTIVPVVEVQNISCFGVVDGSLQANISGGVPFSLGDPYTILWNGPSGFTASSANISNLYAGDYTLTVTDSRGCQVVSTYTITEPKDIRITNNYVNPPRYFGATNGKMGITITGGTPPYTYSWVKDGLAFSTNEDLDSIGSGLYELTVSDAHSCGPKTAFYDIQTPPELLITLVHQTNLDCFGDSNGTISVYVEGGVPIQITPGIYDYLYSWSGPNGFTSTNKNLTNLLAGTYILTVSDNTGFTKQLKVIITQPDQLNIDITTTQEFDCTTQTVYEKCTALVTGGVAPYHLVWSRGTTSGVNNEIMRSNQSGTASLQVTDSIGCTNSYSLNLQIAPIGIDYKAIDCDKHVYQFDAIVLDPSVTYTYLWDFGSGVTDTNKTTSHTFPAAGSYNVQLTISSSACTTTFKQLVIVEGPPALKLDREPVFCKGDSIIVHVSGASTYIWNNSTIGDSILINHVGDYNVIGTSKSGCTGVLTFKATNYDLDNYTIQTNKGEVSVENPTLKLWSESIPSSNYYWDFGDGNTAQGNSQEHVFNLTTEKYFDVKLKVVNPNGCEEYAIKKIYVMNSALYNTFTPNGDGIDDVFMKGWQMKVYNRNGILLYDGIDGWDGTYKGKQASNGTYFYILYYNTESGTKTSSGYVTVVR